MRDKKSTKEKLSQEDETNFKIFKYRLRKTKDPFKIGATSRALDKKLANEAKVRKKKRAKHLESVMQNGSFIEKRKKL